MPFYQYSATDSAGQTLNGTVQAGTAGEALQMLIGRGFRAPRIIGERQPSTVPSQQRPAPQAAMPVHQAPAGKIQINAPAAAYKPSVHHTKKSSDKDIFFLFAQIGEQLRAGIGPVQVFSELSRIYKDPKYRDSLGMVSLAASEGRPISAVLEQWPDLYPEHVVGLIRAGEKGGFLPESATAVSEQAGNAFKFKRFHWWVWLVAINLLSIPLMLMFRHALLGYADQQLESNGSNSAGLAGPFIEMGHKLVWPWGPIIILLCAAVWVLRNYFSLRRMRHFRHKIGLRMPVLGARSRNESVTVFSWVLSKLSKAGIPPNQSWELAVESVPNLAMQDKLRTAGSIMNEGSRISDVVFRSELFPQEYAPTIATGELTGDISGALERLSQISRVEYEASTVKSKAFTGSLGCTALIVTTGIVTIILTWFWYHEIYGKFIDQADNPTATAPAAPNSGNPNQDDVP